MQYRENGETGYSQKCICRSDLILWGWGVVVMVEAARVSQFCSFLITVAAGTSHLASHIAFLQCGSQPRVCSLYLSQ